jgi:hypothetical protein
MATFTIKQVKAILAEHGIPEENVTKCAEAICAAHKIMMDAVVEERDAYKKEADKVPGLEKKVSEYEASDGDGWQEKYTTLTKDYEKYKAEVEAEKAANAKKAAFGEILTDAGITSEAARAKVIKYTDFSGYELDDKGKLKDAKKILKAVQEEWPELRTQKKQMGAETENPPAGGGHGVDTSKIWERNDKGQYTMSTAQRQAAIAQKLQEASET